jgi:hypothetical protein
MLIGDLGAPAIGKRVVITILVQPHMITPPPLTEPPSWL